MLKTFFAIIRGCGGNRDNPTPQQFRSAFRQIVCEKLLIQSPSSNCKVDFDKVLLDLSCLTCKRATTALEPPHTAISYTDEQITEILKCTEIMSVANPPCIPTENVTTYIAGYLLQKLPIKHCVKCETVSCLSVQGEAAGSSARYTFIHEKAYGDNFLKYPSEVFSSFIDELEAAFVVTFPFYMHRWKVLTGLVLQVKEKCMNICSCGSAECIKHYTALATLYMKVRLHHALKMSNITNAESAVGKKRNRKMLKLMHI